MKKQILSEKGITLIKLIIVAVAIFLVTGTVFIINKPDSNKKMEADYSNTILNNQKDEVIFKFEESKAIKLNKIFNANLIKNFKYNVYLLGGDVTINVGEKDKSLEDALNDKDITTDDIILQLEKDVENDKCKENFYLDGGSKDYFYEDFTVVVTARLVGNEQDIAFMRKGYSLNSFERMLENDYSGSDYQKGIGMQYTVKEVINDNLLLVYFDENSYYFVDTTDLDFDTQKCNVGDKLDIVYSGSYEDAEEYTVSKYKAFNRSTYKTVPVKITIMEEFQSENQNLNRIDEIIGERLWVVSSDNSEYKDYLIIDEDDIIEGTPKVGAYINASKINENEMVTGEYGGSIYYLKDVTRIENNRK